MEGACQLNEITTGIPYIGMNTHDHMHMHDCEINTAIFVKVNLGAILMENFDRKRPTGCSRSFLFQNDLLTHKHSLK